MLFTAAPSIDVVKDLQDKIISLQDHEVAFLNTTISNMWAAVAIGVTIIVAISGGVLTFVTVSNNRAKKRMKEATKQMLEATEKLKSTEQKNKDLDQKMAEANKILTDAQTVADFAQGKLEELDKKQRELTEYTIILGAQRKAESMLVALKQKLKNIKVIFDMNYSEDDERLVSFMEKYKILDRKYEELNIELLNFAVEDMIPSKEYVAKLMDLNESTTTILDEYFANKSIKKAHNKENSE